MEIDSNHTPKTTSHSAVQAVIFDLDGVLINSEWLAFKTWQSLAREHGGFLPDSAFAAMAGISAEATMDYVMQHAGVKFEKGIDINWLWNEMTRLLTSQAKAMPGAIELVHELARRGYPLAVASNSIASYGETALQVLGLLDDFPVRVYIDQVAQGKPAPDVYLRAAELCDADPRRCLAIEDSRTGVQSAVSAGMRVIAVPESHDDQDGFAAAWRIYPSLVQVRDDLDELLSQTARP